MSAVSGEYAIETTEAVGPRSDSDRPEERYVARWERAWAHGAVGPCLDAHAETIAGDHTLYVQPLFDAVTGERGMRAQFESVFELIPDLRADLDHWAIGDGTAFVEFTLRGTLGGKPVSWRGADRMSLDGELLVECETYYDPLPLLLAAVTRPRAWLTLLRLRLVPRLRPRRRPAWASSARGAT